MESRNLLPLLVLCALAVAGCLGSSVDMPDRVRVTNGSALEGDATVRFRDAEGALVHERDVALSPGSMDEFLVNLTSDVRYTAEVVVGGRVLVSEPFVTGLGEWHVYLTVMDDGLRVSTLHGD